LRGGVASLFDQGLTSLSSFLTAVILAKGLSAVDFGVYTVLATLLIVLSLGVSTPLITQPLRVFGAAVPQGEAPDYFSSQLLLQTMLGLLLAAVAFTFVVADAVDLTAAAALGLCVLASCLQEFVRVMSTARFRWSDLLIVDLLGYGGRVVVLFWLLRSGAISVTSALLTIAVTHTLAIAAHAASRERVRVGVAHLRKIARQNWQYGKWLLLESAVFTVSTQSYVFLVASQIDAAAAGMLGAAQVLVNSLNVVFLGAMNFAIPVASRRLRRDGGYFAWRRWLTFIGTLLLGVTVAISLLLSWFAAPLMSALFGEPYAEHALLVPLLCVGAALQSVGTVLSAAFRTSGSPEIGFVQHAVAALVTLFAAYPLIDVFGVGGAAFGLVLTQLCGLLVGLFYATARRALGEREVLRRVGLESAPQPAHSRSQS
jgi:O-antigen/teichoic acid export membrane protein